MDDNSKTIAQILKEIDDKTADRSEVLPLLKSIERNTSKATASAMGVAVEKAMVKATARSEKRQRTSTAGKRQQQASTAIVTSSKKNSSSPGKERSGPLLVQTRDSKSGRFVANAPGARNIAAEQKQDTQNDKLSSILKDAVMQKKDTIKDTAGKLAFGPFWDIGKELKEAADAMKDNAKDEKSTVGRLKNWGKGARLGKAAGNAKDRVLAKYQDRKAAKAAKTVAPAAANTTVVNNNGGGGGIVSEIAGNWLGNKVGGSKMGGKLLSKVPMLGKLFPSLAGGAAAAGAAGTVAAGAGGAVAGGAAKAAGGGMLKAVGGRLPLIGGLISGGITLAQGGSASEAVGSGVGAVGGAALGTMVAGPIGTVVGGIAGEWIGKKLGGLFDKQNKAQDGLARADETRQQQDVQQQQGFFSSIGSMFSSLPEKFTAFKDKAKDAVSGGYQAYKESREKGGGFLGSIGAGIGAVAAKFESGKGGAGTISSGVGDHGGKSYGTFQLSSKQGSVDSFLQKSGYAGQFQGMKVGSKEFDAQWKNLAKNDPKFSEAQNQYASQKYAAPQLAKLQKMGLNTNDRAIQEMAMSTGVQYGENSGVLEAALKGKDVTKMSTADIINTVQDYKASSVGTRFKKSSASVQRGVAKRHDGAERQALLSLVGQKTDGQSPPTSPTGTSATGGGQKASGAGPASSQVVPNDAPENKPAVAKSRGKSSKSSKKNAPTQPVTAQAIPAVQQEKQEWAATVTTEGQAQKAAAPAVVTGTATKPESAPATTTAAPQVATTTGTVVKKEEPPPQPGQPTTAQAIPVVQPADPSVTIGTATMPQKQYGAGDIFNERKSIDEASKQKKAKMLSDFRSGKTTEADYVKAVAEEDKARNEKKDSLAALTKKAESGQFVSQEEMDKATGKATSQPDTVQALSVTQPPLPEVKRLQPAPPPPMEVPAIDKLAKAQEQQAQAQQQNSSKAQDGSGGKPGIPNIKTDFDDTMLVLMSYDRT